MAPADGMCLGGLKGWGRILHLSEVQPLESPLAVALDLC